MLGLENNKFSLLASTVRNPDKSIDAPGQIDLLSS
jgi:hypothetical protein